MAPGTLPGMRAPEPLAPDGRPLPSRRLVLRLDEFMVAASPYKVFAGSVVNINGLGGGGGEATLVRQLPKDTASATDSTTAADTVSPDTVPPPAPDRRGRGGWPFLAEGRR